MLNKLFQRCPLVSNVIRSAAIFDLTVLVYLPKTILLKRMKTLLMEIIESKIMSSTDSDKTASEFNGLIDSEVKKLRVKFELFDYTVWMNFTFRKFKFKTTKHCPSF